MSSAYLVCSWLCLSVILISAYLVCSWLCLSVILISAYLQQVFQFADKYRGAYSDNLRVGVGNGYQVCGSMFSNPESGF